MSAPDVDAVVVGSGPNGLVAAVTLAEAGWHVVVLEAADRAGGGLRTEDLTLPGFHHDLCATVHALALASPAFRALHLEHEGLEYAHPAVPLGHAITPNHSVLLHRSVEATAAALGGDGPAWQRLVGGLAAHWPELAASVLDPTALPPNAPRELMHFGLRGLWPATALMRSLFREDDARSLVAGLGAHAMLDLREPVTGGIAVFLAALAHGVGWPVAVGGSERIAEALIARLARLGGEVRTGEHVRSLGRLPSARAVLLDLTPRQVIQVAGDRLPIRYTDRLARWRYGPGVFKLDWALDGAIPWRDPVLAAAGTVHIGGPSATVVASERAVARGSASDDPYVLLVQASVADGSRAPAGKQTVWAYCHVPHGSPMDMTAVIERRIETFAPGFRDLVLARHAMGPAALEAHNANEIGGDIGGGVTDWRQLLSRPVPSPTPWATPRPGLYLCSASTLPGGGAHGMAGWNAAKLALARAGDRPPARSVGLA